MVRFAYVLVLAAVVSMAGCAGRNQAVNEPAQGQGNLDPELAELNQLKFSRGRPLTEEERGVLSANSEIHFHLTNDESDQVTGYVQYFLETKRDTVRRWLTRAKPHLQYVRAVLASHKLPQDLIALPFIESGYNVFAYSSSGAGGMWQFMPATGRRFGLRVDYWIDERRNPYLATVAAAKYLAELHGRFGDWQLALAGYNAGEGKVSRAMAASGKGSFKDLAKDETWLREETRNYVPKFLAMVKVFKNLKSLGFEPVDLGDAPVLKEISVPGGTDLAALAAASGMSYEEFRDLNPAFRRQVSPPDESSPVYLPTARVELAQAYLKNPGTAHPGCRMIAASRGETWWRLSSATGVPVSALRRLNHGLSDTLAPGQTVLVPADSSPADAMVAGVDEHQGIEHKPVNYAQVKKAESFGQLTSRMALTQPKTDHKGKIQTVAYNAPVVPAAKPEPYRPGQTHAAASKNAASSMQAIASTAGDLRARAPQADKTAAKPGLQLMADKSAGTAHQTAKPAQAAPAKPAATPDKSNDKAQDKNQGGGAKKAKYMVARGETVWSIARKLNVNPHVILAENNLNADVRLREGDVIQVGR